MKSRTSMLVAALASLTLLILVVADVAIPGGEVALSPLFALSPLVACVVLPASRTVWFAVAALGATVVSALWNDTLGTPQYIVRVIDVGVMSTAAVVVAWVRVRQQRQLGHLTALAEVAQRAILPGVPPHARGTDIAVRYQSATEDTVVGGDLYDCYHSSEHTRFLIGDVRGKGIEAVEQAARVIRAFRQAAAIHPDLHTVAAQMSGYLVPFFEDEEFVTAFLLDTTRPGRPRMVNAGHPPPLLVRPDQSHQFLESIADLPLGLGAQFSTHQFEWQPGDRLLLYTDGVSEARDRDGRFLDLRTLAPLMVGQPLETTLDTLLAAIRRHSAHGDFCDDVAMILLEYTAVEREERSPASQYEWLTLVGP